MTHTTLNSAVVIGIALVTTLILFLPRVVGSPVWRATVTPLASIIGSGFLILGPLLQQTYGAYATVAMAALCLVAFGFGSAIRFNILALVDGALPGRVARRLDRISAWALAFAYIVSVAYYVRLFGSFAVELTPVNDVLHAKLVTTALLAAIGLYGFARGLRALEHLEEISVGLKLGIIAGLIAGLAFYLAERASGPGLPALDHPEIGWRAVLVGFGLLITVQGFETSRYLGAAYDAETRVRTMRNAQLIASAIYVVFIALATVAFAGEDVQITETAVIDLTRVVAPILPILLVVAALAAQLSAAVADTNGGGGLAEEVTGGRLKASVAYLVLTGAAIALVWFANVFEIVSYASRAFAVYYALQCAVATLLSWHRSRRLGGFVRTVLYSAMTILSIAIAAVGIPAD